MRSEVVGAVPVLLAVLDTAALLGCDELDTATLLGCDELDTATLLGWEELDTATLLGCDELDTATLLGWEELDTATLLGCDELDTATLLGCDELDTATLLGCDELEVGAGASSAILSNLNQLILKPLLKALIPKVWRPAGKVTVCSTLTQVCQLPVLGTVTLSYSVSVSSSYK
jgi:hypothetical protein